MRTVNRTSVILPENFDADAILNQTTYRPDKKRNLKGTMYIILHTLLQMEYRKDLRDDFEDRGYYPLSSDILISICGNRYKEALELLEQNRVIDSDKNSNYSTGRFSKGYRIIDPYSVAQIKWRELPLGGVRDRFLEARAHQLSDNENALSSIPHLIKWLDGDKISIDTELARYFIGYYRQMMTDQIPAQLPTSLTQQEVINRINQRYNSSALSVRKIMEHDFSPTKTGRDHRLHTSISSIKSELRTLITYGNKHLVSLDLTASQPYLFTLLLNPDFYQRTDNDLSVYGLYPELYTLISSPQYSSDLNTIIMSTTYAGTQRNSFRDIDWSQDFYTYFGKKLSSVVGDPENDPKVRNRVKKTVMLLLYNKKPSKYKTPEFRLFGELFPQEASLIRFFDSLEGDNYLPVLLQRLESKLMLEKVAKIITERIPDAPLLTVHDSFLTTPAYAEEVKTVMYDSFIHYTSVAPGIKLEEYDHDATMRKIWVVAMEDLNEIVTQKRKTPAGSSRTVNVQIGLRNLPVQ